MAKGPDILLTLGGIKTIEEAQEVFKKKMDDVNLSKINAIKTEEALLKIANAIVIGDPDKVIIVDGSKEVYDFIRQYALEKGEEEKLAIEGHTVHFDLPEEQGRLINQTFYIVDEDEKISSMAKKEPRDVSMQYIKENFTGIMKGKILFVGFYSRGPVGAKASIPAIEMSTSAYVFHSAELLYRNCYKDFDKEVQRRGEFFTNVHSEGDLKSENIPRARIYMDRNWQTTFSMYCTYAGNTLLLKKGNHRFAVDSAVYKHFGEELSEHMFITGVTDIKGRLTYIVGAAPSGCGKTTTAMVGDHFVSDDLAQLWIAEDGTIRAVNPEHGIFGIVEDVNYEGDPYLMKALREPGEEVIFSNVLVTPDGTPRWTGDGDPIPERGRNFQGEWTKDMLPDVPMSHPNARCTLRSTAIANYDEAANSDPNGVKVSVITYSGRDSDTMPPIWVAKSMDEGVVIGASIVSKATATEIGATGVRRQPWANAPFIPGSLGDYLEAQFKFFNNEKLKEKPIIAGLNYFLTHEARGGSGKGLIGEKKDVHVWLGWLALYAHGDVEVIDTPIGYIPTYEDLKELFNKKINKEYPREIYEMQFSLYIDNIVKRIEMQEEAWSKEENVSPKLFEIYKKQKEELLKLKEEKGAIVKPWDL